MSHIWKYRVILPETKVALPPGAKFLAVQEQDGEPHMWFCVEAAIPKRERTFVVVATGMTFDADSMSYLGTFQLNDGLFVGHLWERGQS